MLAIVCGDRHWTNLKRIKSVLKSYNIGKIIQGDCKGADKLAAQAALSLKIKVVSCPADWETHGRAAGPIRNRQMLELEPEIVLAFHNNLANSKGTINMLKQSKKKGVLCYLITDDNIIEY